MARFSSVKNGRKYFHKACVKDTNCYLTEGVHLCAKFHRERLGQLLNSNERKKKLIECASKIVEEALPGGGSRVACLNFEMSRVGVLLMLRVAVEN